MAERQGGSTEEYLSELIPGLPDEVGMLCLARLPFGHHPLLSRVCRSWRRALKLPLLFDIRARLGFQEHFIFSFFRSGKSTKFYLIDCRLAKSYRLPPPPGLRGYPYAYGFRCDVVALGRQVLIFPDGAFPLGDDPESCDCPQSWEPLCFDVVSRLWCTQSMPMLQSRSCFASAAVDGYVYAAGGLGRPLPARNLKTAERFDHASEKWERIPDMTEERFMASAVVWKGSFCVFGGRPSGYRIKHDSAEVWDALKEEWQLIPSILPYDMSSVAAVKGKLFALKNRDAKEVMLFDEKRNHWILLGSLTGDLKVDAVQRLIGVGDELCMLAIDALGMCVVLSTDPESLPLCWRLLPSSFYPYPSNVCVVTL